MATSSDFLPENQFRCSICLDLFTDPVSTPCGHTFCKVCLARHWAGKQECQCPLCNNKINKDLKLSVNTTFREVVDNFKRHHPTADATSLLKPWEVSCDVCTANKLRASKTCLVCLASFCETHLEPHLRVASLQRHKLSNPVPNLEEKICREHNRIVEFFCLNDHVRLCALCSEHSDHDTVSLNEAYIDQRSPLWRRKESVHKTEQRKNKSAQSKKKGKGVQRKNVNAQTTAPPNFTGCNCMFHNQGIIRGKAFYDIQVNRQEERDECDLAAVRQSTLKTMAFPPSWDGCCIARFPVRRNTRRIMVLIDYDYGLVLFLDPDNDILIHKLTVSRFNEQIALCFVPRKSEHFLGTKEMFRFPGNLFFVGLVVLCLVLFFSIIGF